MNRKFTPLLKLYDINTESIDLLADAYGYEYQYLHFFEVLSAVQVEPDDQVVCNLLSKL